MLFKNLKNIPEFIAGDKTIIKEVLHPKNDAVELGYSLAHAVVKPGEKSLPHILHTKSEAYFILEGQGMVYIDKKSKLLSKGDTVLIPAGANQWIENTGSEDLEFLAIVSPPWSEETEEIL